MDDLADQIEAHGNPLIEDENKHERLIKGIARSESDELARERFKDDIRFSRLPDWMKAYELGITTPGVDDLDYPERLMEED